MGVFGGTELIIILFIYLLPIIFVIWMVYRFVKAQEKMADGVTEIARKIGNENTNI